MIFIDLDGPVLDVSERYYQSYLNVVNKNGGIPLSKCDYWNLKRSKTSIKDIVSKSNLSMSSEEYNKERIKNLNDNKLLSLDRVWKTLSNRGDKIFKFNYCVLVTLRPNRKKLMDQLRGLGILHWFKDVLSIDPAGDDKKWKKKVELLINNGYNEKNSILIGDTETDINAAKHLFFKSIAVTFGIRNKNLMVKTEPDLICESPEQLVDTITGALL